MEYGNFSEAWWGCCLPPVCLSGRNWCCKPQSLEKGKSYTLTAAGLILFRFWPVTVHTDLGCRWWFGIGIVIGPILWSYSGPLCHALSLSSLLWTSMRSRVRQWRRAAVATPGEWQCKTGRVRRLTVVNGSNIFQMLLVLSKVGNIVLSRPH